MHVARIVHVLVVIVTVIKACTIRTPTPTPGPECPSDSKLDIAVIVDSSGSIGPENYARNFPFISNFLDNFNVAEDGTKVSLLTFGTGVRDIFSLTGNRNFINEKLKNVPYQGSTTNTHKALEYVINVFTVDRGGRYDAKKVVVLITDARSTDRNKTIEAAGVLRDLEIVTAVVTVGNKYDQEEVNAIASLPEYIFPVGDYTALNSFAKSLAKAVCEATPQPPTPNPCPPIKKVNLVFVIDSSGSIGPENYAYNFRFIEGVLRSFEISPDAAEVAAITFGTSVRRLFSLTSNEDLIYEKLQNVAYQGSTTNTHIALNYLLTSDLLAAARPESQTVVILVTDGLSTVPDQTLVAADAVRAARYIIITLGVGPDANQKELTAVASRPEYVFQVGDYSFLNQFASSVSDIACSATPEPTTPVPTTTTTTTTTPEPTTTQAPTTQPTTVCPATRKLDVVFIVDSSGSIGPENYALNFKFISNILNDFNVDKDGTAVGLITYGTHVREIFLLSGDRNFINEKLKDVPYQGSTTNTHVALQHVINLFTVAKGGRPDAKKVVILLTDARSTQPSETIKAANVLRDLQIITAVVGVGSRVDKGELNAIASKPEYIFTVGDYNGLDSFVRSVSDFVCDATPEAPTAKPCPPAKEVNLCFVIDSSGSIGPENYAYNFRFIETVLSGFVISENSAEVALITFGTTVRPIFSLSSDRDFVLEKIKNVPYQGSTTNTHDALNYTLTSKLLEGSRPGSQTVIILVTDGLSSVPEKTVVAADAVKAAGYTVAALGVGPDANQKELTTVASRPEYVFSVGDYSFLDQFASSISDIACSAPDTPEPTTPEPTTPEPTTPEPTTTAAPTTTTTLKPVKPCPPARRYNLIFVIDSSGSIGAENYKNNFIFVERFLGGYQIAEDKTKVALITYGSSVRLIFNSTGDRDLIYQKLQNVPYQGSTTNTHLALRYVNERQLAGDPRPDTTTVVILVTDGKSSVPSETPVAAQEVKDRGYLIVTVGVTKAVDWNELQTVASRPEYVFEVGDYNGLSGIAADVSDAACGA